VENKFHDIIELLKKGDAKTAWHKLGEHLHGPGGGGVHTNDGGNNGPPPPPTKQP
jgi:hypothetical protein